MYVCVCVCVKSFVSCVCMCVCEIICILCVYVCVRACMCVCVKTFVICDSVCVRVCTCAHVCVKSCVWVGGCGCEMILCPACVSVSFYTIQYCSWCVSWFSQEWVPSTRNWTEVLVPASVCGNWWTVCQPFLSLPQVFTFHLITSTDKGACVFYSDVLCVMTHPKEQ